MSENNANTARTHNVRRTGINATFIGCVFLGICMLIAGLNIGGNIKSLNKTMSETQFASSYTYNSPSELSIGNKKYLTENEAAEYLNITSQKVIELITSGIITEYIKTDSGYSISVSVLDNWFDNEAYQTKMSYSNNTVESE